MNFSNGNSWDPKVIENCTTCGPKKLCDTCHRHARPRGKCDECPSAEFEEKLRAPVVK